MAELLKGTLSPMFLTSEERSWLEGLLRMNPPAGYQRRAEVLLLTDQGQTSRQIAEHIGLRPSGVRYWRAQFRARGMSIFGSQTGELVGGEQTEESEAALPEPVPVAEIDQPRSTAGKNQTHVRDLALDLFDQTQSLHKLGEVDRRLLAEAVIHSRAEPPKAARKDLQAARAWLADLGCADLALAEQDKLVALLLLQRGKVKDSAIQRLNFSMDQQKEVLVLLGILRIAWGMDASHSQQTQLQAVEITQAGVQVVVRGPFAIQDAAAAQQSAGLWARVGLPRVEVLEASKAQERHAGDLTLPLPLERTNLLADDSLAEAGRKVMLYHFAQMLAHEAGTRLGEDIEELHDMRVATRRMRAAFEVFGEAFEPKVLKTQLKGLRATGRALGHPRDMDVFMEKANLYLNSLPEEQRAGLDPLLAAWEQERQSARADMITYFESPEYAEFVGRFNRFLQTPGVGALPIPTEKSSPHRLREVVPVLIYNRMASVRAFEPVLKSARIEQLHALRIEFKKLRYAVEYFREVLGPEAKSVIEVIKKLQDHLGDLNDADVATRLLRGFLDDWDAQQEGLPISERQNPGGIIAYLAFQHAQRHELMVTFQHAWNEFASPEFRQALAMAIAVL